MTKAKKKSKASSKKKPVARKTVAKKASVKKSVAKKKVVLKKTVAGPVAVAVATPIYEPEDELGHHHDESTDIDGSKFFDTYGDDTW